MGWLEGSNTVTEAVDVIEKTAERNPTVPPSVPPVRMGRLAPVKNGILSVLPVIRNDTLCTGASPSTHAGSPDRAASWGRTLMGFRSSSINRPSPTKMSSISDIAAVLRCQTLYAMSPNPFM